MRGDLRAESSGSLFKGQDIVAASTTGRTACRQCSGQDCNRTESAAVSFHQRCGCLSDKRIFYGRLYLILNCVEISGLFGGENPVKQNMEFFYAAVRQFHERDVQVLMHFNK